MIADWRLRWNIGDFPFNFAQLSPYEFNDVMAYMREAQANCAKSVPNCEMAILLDVGDEKFMHTPMKEVVGERFAYLAFAKTYNMKGFEYTGPIYKSMEIVGDKIKINFDHASNGLTSKGQELTDFEISGDDRVFHPAKAEITPKGFFIYSSEVTKPVAARYGFKSFVKGSLFNLAGLPASSFRTDNW